MREKCSKSCKKHIKTMVFRGRVYWLITRKLGQVVCFQWRLLEQVLDLG